MHEVLVNRLGGLSLPRKSVVRLTDRPDMTLDVYRGRKTTNQIKKKNDQHNNLFCSIVFYPVDVNKNKIIYYHCNSLNIETDISEQTEQTQIRLLL